MTSPCVYEIVCTTTDQRYVGSSTRFYKRLLGHFKTLRRGRHPNPYLQHVYDLYGEDTFTVNILETCTAENMLEREQYYIDTLKPELNIALSSTAPMLGRKKTAESVEKSASKVRGRTRKSKETDVLDSVAPSSYYRTFPDEVVVKIREMYATGKYSYVMIAESLGVSDQTIMLIVQRRRYKHIP